MNDEIRHDGSVLFCESCWLQLANAYRLSNRQLQVLQRLLLGQSDNQITTHLGIKLATLRAHMAQCFGKLSVETRTMLVLRVLGFVPRYGDSNGYPFLQHETRLEVFSIDEWKRLADHIELSGRPYQVLQALFEGLNDRDIAERLDMSYWTVRTHLTKLFKKFNVQDRNELVIRVFRQHMSMSKSMTRVRDANPRMQCRHD